MPADNNERPLDRRIQRTLAAIDAAFANLLRTTDYRKITVSAIAREANINRKTFYLHYSSVDDVLRRVVGQIVERVVEEAEQSSAATNPEELLPDLTLKLLQEFHKKSDLEGNLVKDMPLEQMIDLVSVPLERCIAQSYRSKGFDVPEHLDYYVACYLGALFSVYETWRRTDMADSLEEAIGYIRQFIQICSQSPRTES